MTRYSYDDAVAEHRIRAYTRFLLDAYETDLDGLAEIAGVSVRKMREHQTADYCDLNAVTIVKLARLTGVSVSWLFAESEESEVSQ